MSVISDDSLNRLAKYLHKELRLTNLNCNYDINESKCRECIKRNKYPSWDAANSNSVGLAKKLGYECDSEYKIYKINRN